RKNQLPHNPKSIEFNPALAGQAIVSGLEYLKNRLHWSGTKIAHILHLPANTVNTWLKNGVVPISNAQLHPDIQAIIHLLAIHRSLEAMFDDPSHQRLWLSTMHPELNAIPEKLMSESIDGIIYIRQYLDYVRGRGA
ncbi:MAG TPA: antitoxin Xre/MbcA/ParS toxin-binding domain-containing protein, partial [Candidatus Saccharimonadales bacterium]|nr:antitoxin Xre/MbcA/ParS toxin-binding domain-containing protein [Candidatus Saccharimonadales bacterium]